MKVIVPSQLRGYTGGQAEVQAQGQTLDAALWDLNRQFPGFRFRVIDEQDQVRRHIVLFVNGERQDDLGSALEPDAEIFIIGALSGGL